ncbi:universal stress protein UspA [Haloterrigena sp. SYSU A558-1]|uniref:Universal stress protein UspA n=1 Tax=Haloterrigena gelatinilytica TaxID=2741724 RepID=A0ABX2LHS1_9EURY|nr:universal stress protein UspA [Haloterrigena gelatinilytica]NUC74923.1 universal stress protein UspA [Haloterrigena gelatinilytica]
MHYLVGTTSVHTTAAICDYLDERATADDTVTVVAVASADDATARRDAQEALNVAPVRLATVGEVRTELREDDDDPAAGLLEEAATAEADELLITPREVTADATSGVGTTARALLEESSLPVVVVPASEL